MFKKDCNKSNVMDFEKIREDFPILRNIVNGNRLIYFDSAATSQKPKQVIEAIKEYYEKQNANVMRGTYTLSEEATIKYENSRKKIREFINAEKEEEIIFTKNATEALNLIMYSWGRKNINSRDKIVISPLEHHANLVTWQHLAKEKSLSTVA